MKQLFSRICELTCLQLGRPNTIVLYNLIICQPTLTIYHLTLKLYQLIVTLTFCIHTQPITNPLLKRVQFCAIFARVNHVSQPTQKLMLIPINNPLPSICLNLGSVEDEKNKIRMILDTGAAMNPGNLTYHLWVMLECPEMVGSCIQCGTETGYDVVQILATLDLDSSHQPLDHGKITPVIRYKTPYFINT